MLSAQWPLLSVCIACSLLSPALHAETEIAPEQLAFFEKDVRPALIKYCYECHSEEGGQSRGGLLLDTRNGMLEGGSSGALFDETSWEHSLFVDAITWGDSDYEMPPKKQMPAEVIETLKKWVSMGAPDPRVREQLIINSSMDIEAGKAHWAYQAPVATAGASIDGIIQAKQTELGVTPMAATDPLQLIRRLRFDLTGLPPTPDEARAFYRAAQQDPDAATEQLVDQLLASPQYGERWGRHWLDVARFGESSGGVNDAYPYAWRYRDYVIDALNADTPYDRFIQEQLAGDLLPAQNDADWQRNLIATGFLAVGPKTQNEKNPRQFHMDLLDEQIDTTTRAFLGLTVACARCHDHKFDAIPTSDYYAMAGIFNSTKTLWGTISGNQNFRNSSLIELPIPDAEIQQENSKALYQQKVAELDAAMKRNRELRANKDKTLETISQRTLVAQRQKILRLQGELKLLNPDGTPSTFGMGALEGTPADCNILAGGEVTKQAQLVDRGFLQVLDFAGTPEIPANSSGRRELANWISSPDNPLTARVMVNRIWMHLLGSPLVATMDNWGANGLPPSNPALLDHLAIRFVEQGWSMKKLIREIVLSDTYQRASTFDDTNYTKDPANHSYWRATPRQLVAEAIRDAMLSASGQLDLPRPFASKVFEIGDTKIGRQTPSDLFTKPDPPIRSVYLPMAREAVPEALSLFDFADPNRSVGQRDKTNVAPQSLHLMNSAMVQLRAQAMATRLTTAYESVPDQIKLAFVLCYGRPPNTQELTISQKFLTTFEPGRSVAEAVPAPAPGRRRGGGDSTDRAERRKQNQARMAATATIKAPLNPTPLSAFCQSLMMSAEFRILN